MTWFGFEFWFWIFWICAIVLLILCLCLNGFVFFYVSELVLFCSLNGFSVRFGLVLLNERRFMSLCSYILEHVVFVLSVCCVWFWIFWVCFYCEYFVFDFEFFGFVFDFKFFGFVFNFEFFGEKKKTQNFFFYNNHKRSSKWVCSHVFQKRNYRSQPIAVVKKCSYKSDL